MPIYKKTRLDQLLVDRGLAETRSRAAELVRSGYVSVEGALALKPGASVGPGAAIVLNPEAPAFVSRGALKLEAGLEAFAFQPDGRVALDVGASTGGFTEVLIAHGAAKVYAVDVGRDQLHARLRADPRVVALEETDARHLCGANIKEPVGAIVADVSFISLTLALPAALALAAPDAWLIALVKPQFEAGRQAVGRGGVVRSEGAREKAVTRVWQFLEAAGWKVEGVVPSPIRGRGGNVEFLIGARHGG